MASEIKANKISPATGTAFTLGDSGDTTTVPSGATLDVSSATMTGFTIPSGQTLTVASGATIANSGTASGFGSPAYASNASATDDTVNVDASDNLQFNSGFGSTATAYGVRAWANFDSTGTFTIKESKNVSSITDNGAGNFDFNFSSSMSDANYAVAGITNEPSSNPRIVCVTALATSTFKIYLEDLSSNRADADVICIIVVR